jgi:hypothetical protein
VYQPSVITNSSQIRPRELQLPRPLRKIFNSSIYTPHHPRTALSPLRTTYPLKCTALATNSHQHIPRPTSLHVVRSNRHDIRPFRQHAQREPKFKHRKQLGYSGFVLLYDNSALATIPNSRSLFMFTTSLFASLPDRNEPQNRYEL